MSKKKRTRSSVEQPEAPTPGDPLGPPATTSPLPRPLALLGVILAAAGVLMLGTLFVRALPDAAHRAKAGVSRAAEGACEALRPAPGNQTLGEVPVAAPDFELKDYAGRSVRLADLKGSVVLVNFWATWCGTCVVEMPSMEKLVSKLHGKPFRLLAVSVDEEWGAVRKFFAKGSPLEILLDPQRTVPKKYGTDKFPESFIIDRDGQIRYFVVSNRDWSTSDVEICINSLLD